MELLLGIGYVAYRLIKRSVKKRGIKNADKAIAIFLNGGNY